MKSHFLFRGSKVCYSIHGSGNAILFIHGFLGSKEVWKEYQSRLSKGYKVICIDLLGHGESDSIGYLHPIELMAESVSALLKHLNIRKSTIIGHSLGGYVALALAEKQPDSIKRLILLNSTAKGDSSHRKTSREQLVKLVKQNKEKALNLLIPTFFGIRKRNTHWQIKRYLKMAMNCHERGIIASIMGMKERKEREIILKFAPFPFHYIIGSKDPILSPISLIEESKLSELGSYYLIEKGSHMCFWEAEEEVYREIRKFLAK